MSDYPVRMKSVELLSDNWGTLKKYSYDFVRRDGHVEQHTREVYDRGNGAVVLPYDPVRGTVLLIRQFRLPAFVVGHDPMLIEACAGSSMIMMQRQPPAKKPRKSSVIVCATSSVSSTCS